MNQKIAIAAIHGIGLANPEWKDETSPKFVSGMSKPLISEFARLRRETFDEAKSKLVIKPIYWADVVQQLSDELESRLNLNSLSNPLQLRDFIFHYLGDAIAYSASGSKEINKQIHTVFAETLKDLAREAGDKAPLCVVGHSLGGLIASYYIWDLQKNKPIISIGNTTLEKGETLTLFYTFGTQIPLWSMSYQDFGEPIQVPSPQLNNYYSGLKGEWINFYDKDDVLGFPLQNINDAYSQVVVDREVNAGNLFSNWTPLSHNGYWKDDEVIEPIAKALVKTWEAVN
jgi:pimeloyl-ACP methyl ester carboxylesterase